MADASYEAQLRAYELEFQKQQEKLADKQRVEEEKQRRTEEERQRREDEKRRAEEERQRRADEARSKEEARRAEEARKLEDERIRKEEERKRREEEARVKSEEKARQLEEERLRKEAERKAREEEIARKLEEERLRKEESRKQKEELARQKAEEERIRKEELARAKAEKNQVREWQLELKGIEAQQAKLRQEQRKEQKRRDTVAAGLQKELDLENQRVGSYQETARKDREEEEQRVRAFTQAFEARKAVLNSEADVEQRKLQILGLPTASPIVQGGMVNDPSLAAPAIQPRGTFSAVTTPRSSTEEDLPAAELGPITPRARPPLPSPITPRADPPVEIQFPEHSAAVDDEYIPDASPLPPSLIADGSSSSLSNSSSSLSSSSLASSSSSSAPVIPLPGAGALTRQTSELMSKRDNERVIRVALHPKDKMAQALELGSYKMIAINPDTTSAKLEALMIEKLCRTVPQEHHKRITTTCQKYRMHGVDKSGKTTKLKPALVLWPTSYVSFAFL